MPDRVFQDAYARVRGQFDDATWFSLSPREITEAIYREIRAIDLAKANPGQGADQDARKPPAPPLAAE